MTHSDSFSARLVDAHHPPSHSLRGLMTGVDAGVYSPALVDADGHLHVDVESGGSAPASAVATATGVVTASSLNSDSTWTKLIENSGNEGYVLWLHNTSDQPLEIAYNDSPTGTSGVDIDDYIGAGEVRIIDFKTNERFLDVDVHVRRFASTPSAGNVFGTVYL